MASMKAKLNPGRFQGISAQMAAVIGYVVGEDYTQPPIRSLHVTSDGFVLVNGGRVFLGAESDLRHNWENLLKVANLDRDELMLAKALYKSKVKKLW
jgi:hypothetical protein